MNNYYSDEISLYEDCSRLLRELDDKKEIRTGLVAKLGGERSYSEKAIEEVIGNRAAERRAGDTLVCTTETHKYVVTEYYKKKIHLIENQIRLDSLNERAVESSERSAEAAEKSALSAKEANEIANNLNIMSRNTLIISVISIIISIIGLIANYCC